MTQHSPARTAFGQILGHPTKPYLRYFNAPDDGGGAGGDIGAGDDGDSGDGLGDAGKKAIDRMKAERNNARQEAAAFKALGLTVEQIKALQDGSKPADQPDVEQIRKSVEDAAIARLEATARRSAVREQARAAKFHNAADALAEITADDLAKVAVKDDEADEDAVKALVKAVAERKPYLVKAETGSHADAGIGGAGGGNKPEVRPGLDRIRNAYASTK